MPTDYYSRYLSGNFHAVWEDLNQLGEEVRSPEHFNDAYAAACETMRRVRKNIETIICRLTDLGYQFEYPDEVYVPPDQGIEKKIAEIEDITGIFPLSLRAFYQEVGSVNLMQSFQQIVQYYRKEERAKSAELYILGEEDPLVVFPIDWVTLDIEDKQDYYCFAPDEFHKANYSGGWNYHVQLPNPNADFPIAGMYGIRENFVDYLRHSIAFGGFRGKVSTIFESETAVKISPDLDVIKLLNKDTIPF